MRAIYKRELRSCFHSFIGPLFIGVTLFLIGIYFSVYDLFMGYPYIGYALSSVIFLFLVSVPILTMRVLAEERHQKTDQLILTSPVSVVGIVAGKFLALATVFAVPVALVCVYPLILGRFGTVSYGESYTAILGFTLYGLSAIAVCVFLSSLTESQVIAAVLSFGVLLLGYIMSGLCSLISSSGNLLTQVLSAFDMVSRFDDMLNGSLPLTSIVYYLSVILLFLVLTVQSIQKRRYHLSGKNLSLGAYSYGLILLTLGAVVLVNVVTAAIPVKYTVFDVTSNRLYSLSQETKNLTEGLSEDITIYVVCDKEQADNTLDTTLQRYEGLSPHIKVSYVDPAVNPKFYTQYTDQNLTANSLIVAGSRRSKVVDYNEIYESEFDYSTYSSYVTGYDGEGQITSAIAYVISDDMPKIYSLEGHGEQTLEGTFEAAIQKENVEHDTINLMKYEKVPEDADCVIINGPTEDLSADDRDKMLSYMEQGGNVLLITAYTEKKLPNFESLFDFYGVTVTGGMLVEPDGDYYYQSPFYLLPEIGYDTVTEGIYDGGSYVFAPYAQGLVEEEKEDVTVTSLLSPSEECFARQNLDTDTFEKQESDLEGPFKIGLKCEKENSVGIIYASQYLFTESADMIVSGTNSRLFAGTLGSLVSHEDAVSIPAKSYDMEYLTVPQSTIVLLAVVTALIIPAGVLAAGFGVWFQRRRK